MKSWLEASHAISDDAAMAVATGRPRRRPSWPAPPRPTSAQYGAELMQDCVQLHGGIGVTFEHDLHLFLRRHTVDTALYGTPG